MGRGAKTQSAISRGDLPPDEPRGPARTHFQVRRRPGALSWRPWASEFVSKVWTDPFSDPFSTPSWTDPFSLSQGLSWREGVLWIRNRAVYRGLNIPRNCIASSLSF